MSAITLTQQSVDNMSYRELQATCKQLGAKAGGKTADLKIRLAEYINAPAPAPAMSPAKKMPLGEITVDTNAIAEIAPSPAKKQANIVIEQQQEAEIVETTEETVVEEEEKIIEEEAAPAEEEEVVEQAVVEEAAEEITEEAAEEVVEEQAALPTVVPVQGFANDGSFMSNFMTKKEEASCSTATPIEQFAGFRAPVAAPVPASSPGMHSKAVERMNRAQACASFTGHDELEEKMAVARKEAMTTEDEGMVMEEECAPTSGPVRTHMRFGDDGAVAVDTMPLTATSTAAPTMDTASTSVSVEVPMDRNVEMHLAKMGMLREVPAVPNMSAMRQPNVWNGTHQKIGADSEDESEEEDEVEINIRVGSSKSEVAKRGSKVSVAETDMLDALMDNMAM